MDNERCCWDFGTPQGCRGYGYKLDSGLTCNVRKHVLPAERAFKWAATQPITPTGSELYHAICTIRLDADDFDALLARAELGPNTFVQSDGPYSQTDSRTAVEIAAQQVKYSEGKIEVPNEVRT